MNQKYKNFYTVLTKTLTYCMTKLPKYFIGFILVSILLSGANFLSIFVMQKMIDDITMFHNTASYRPILYIIILTCSSYLMYYFLKNYYEYFKTNYFYTFMSKILSDMNSKAGRLELLQFESLELYKTISLAISGVSRTVQGTISLVNAAIVNLTFFIGISVYFFSIKPAIFFLCLIFFVPKFLSQILKGSKLYQLQDRIADVEREYTYYQRCLIGTDNFKETKTLRAQRFFLDKYLDKLRMYNNEQWKTELKLAGIDCLLNCVTYLGYAGSFLLLVYYLVQGDISLGVFSALYYSLNRMLNSMNEMIQQFGEVYENITQAGRLYDFLDLQEDGGKDMKMDQLRTIELKNVAFSYPNTEHPTLKDLTLQINKGERVAIVGVNGSGKTTLVKILAGLFKPCQGSVLYNENNIALAKQEDIYSHLSAVFQNFGRYKLSLKDNVILSNIYHEENEENIQKALYEAGFCLEKLILPEGLDTSLSREFGGIELSGGEWQRLAIARGLYRDAEIIFLDEPTSAIDPIEEANVYNKFIEITKGKTSIIVTHRLGSVKFADRILVMESGRLIEDGTHESLLEKGGVYANMFLSQAQWYR